jgi:hypothetical protein
MPKVKTSELVQPALDWAVAKALGEFDAEVKVGKKVSKAVVLDGSHGVVWMRTGDYFRPSGVWAQGGPIIEREEICLEIHEGGHTRAAFYRVRSNFDGKAKGYGHAFGPTPLIAAMRCYVAWKLGDEIDIPEELTK